MGQRFRLKAMDNFRYSNCAYSKTGASGSTDTPINLKAISVSDSKINLTWQDNSTNEANFKIYRKIGTGPWALFITTGVGVTSYSDITATGNSSTTAYSYYIKACNSSGCSLSTNATVIPCRPEALTVRASPPGQINLTWADKNNSETGFSDIQEGWWLRIHESLELDSHYRGECEII